MVLSFVVLSGTTTAQNPVTLYGSVRGRQGDPKPFVSVSLEGPGRYVAMTDAKGTFTIPNVIPGTYKVRVRRGDLVDVFTRDVGSSRIELTVKW